MEEEKRFKVVEIEHWNAEIEGNKKIIRNNSIFCGFVGLGIVVGCARFVLEDSIYWLNLIVITPGLISSLKTIVKAILRNVVLEQKLADIESNVDERIAQILANIQLNANERMQESMEEGKTR